MLKFSEEHAVIKDMRIKGAASTPDGEKLTEADLTVQVDVSDRMWTQLEDLFPGCGLVSKHCAALDEEEGAHGDTRSTKRDIGTVTLVIGYDGKTVATLNGVVPSKTFKLATLVKGHGAGQFRAKFGVKLTNAQLAKIGSYVGADLVVSVESAQMDLLGGIPTSDANVVQLHG
jgi:hypothetical protein